MISCDEQETIKDEYTSSRKVTTRRQRNKKVAYQTDDEDCEPDQKRHQKTKNDKKPVQKMMAIRKAPALGYKA